MTVTHIILCRFKDGVDEQAIEEICRDILSLKDTCVMPDTENTYIKSFTGGKDCSPERAQNGMTHGFVAKFESEEHRDYYAFQDPVHLALGVKFAPMVERCVVLDFVHNDL